MNQPEEEVEEKAEDWPEGEEMASDEVELEMLKEKSETEEKVEELVEISEYEKSINVEDDDTPKWYAFWPRQSKKK